MNGTRKDDAEDLSQFFYLVQPEKYLHYSGTEAPEIFRKGQFFNHYLRLYLPDKALDNVRRSYKITYLSAWPYFLTLMVLEYTVQTLKGRSVIKFGDGIVSISHGILLESFKIVSKGLESCLYVLVYDHFRIVDYPGDSICTWYASAVAVDFCYYWFHRANHEIHFLWAQHQVHHSSEDFNLAVGLRQSMFHTWCGFIFYLPLAFAIPPAQMLIHQQFNLLYQFWIHTEMVGSLGPLEYVFNTPAHHRVHHASNLIYLDKNYGGVLVVWDKLFGTFAEFSKSQKITYGLVFQPQTFNPLYLQFFYNANIFRKISSVDGIWNKISSVIKGPSWTPGSKWTGDNENKIDIQWREPYYVHLHLWKKIYLFLHFCLILRIFGAFAVNAEMMSSLGVAVHFTFILMSLTAIGMFLDDNPAAPLLEIIRCFGFCLAGNSHPSQIHLFYLLSALFWGKIASKMPGLHRTSNIGNEDNHKINQNDVKLINKN